MADEEGFLRRWSRQKQAQKTPAAAVETAVAPAPAPPPPRDVATCAPAPEAEPEAVDLASLPPIESLGADSDYTAFLRPGVPQSMQIAALRRLWLTDPSVRNYEALVEYAWDFNAPGYGALLPSDDVQKLLKSVLGEREESAKPAEPEAAPESAPRPVPAAALSDAVRRSTEAPGLPPRDAAASVETAETTQVHSAAEASKPRRRHGGALPHGVGDTQSG